MAKEQIILGVDPGTTVMGYSLIKVTTKIELLEIGIIKLSKFPDHGSKLKHIFERISSIINAHHPDEMAIEAPFFGKNVQSMLKLGRAQGVAIAAALSKSVPYTEYAPRKIKQSITGKGSASKEQVAAMLWSILKIKPIDCELDATDGLAAAVCHHFQGGVKGDGKSYTGWKAFIADNPKRKG